MPGRFRALLPRKLSSGSVELIYEDVSYACLDPNAPRPTRPASVCGDIVSFREAQQKPLRSDSSLSQSIQLESPLSQEQPVSVQQQKILVLGSSQSGKSTVMKQLRLLYAVPDEITYMRETYRLAIYLDLIELTSKCLNIVSARDDAKAAALRTLRLTPILGLAPKLERCLSTRHSSINPIEPIACLPRSVKDSGSMAGYIFSALSAEISGLFGETFSTLTPTKYQQYLIARQEQICSSMYIPDDKDILEVQLDTIGIEECRLRMSSNLDLQFCDVSGSRGLRQVWSRFFEDAACIIFDVDASAFDKPTSKGSNQLEDSLKLLSKVCRNPLLKKVEIAVYLNKCDLLKKKIRGGANLIDYFCDLQQRGGSYQAGLEYLKSRIQRIALEDRPNTALGAHVSRKQMTVQVIQATDAKQVMLAMENLKDSLCPDPR